MQVFPTEFSLDGNLIPQAGARCRATGACCRGAFRFHDAVSRDPPRRSGPQLCSAPNPLGSHRGILYPFCVLAPFQVSGPRGSGSVSIVTALRRGLGLRILGCVRFVSQLHLMSRNHLTMRWSERLVASALSLPDEIPPSNRSYAGSRQPSLIVFSLDL